MKRNFRCSGMCSMVIIKARPLKALASISIGKLYIANLKLFFSTLLLYYLLCIPDSRTLFSNLVFDPLFLYENKKPFYTVIKIISLVILCRFSGIYFKENDSIGQSESIRLENRKKRQMSGRDCRRQLLLDMDLNLTES